MKILHTADWHVGRALRGRSRVDEHRAALAEIVEIADREHVDLVLVAGDQFDGAAPSPESEEIVLGALLDLARTGARVAVVAGNHDNPRRLAALSPLLELAGVDAGAFVRPPDDGGVIGGATRSGERYRLALFPFQSQRGIVKAAELMTEGADRHQQSYARRCRGIARALCRDFRPDAVNLVLAHLTIVGAAEGGGERRAHVFDYYLPADVFPETAHYVALGHIHKPQRIPGRCPIHYAGSPFALDFGETHSDHSVRVVEVTATTPARVRTVPLEAGRRLVTLQGRAHELAALAGTTGDDFLRLIVEESASPGLNESLRETFPHAVDVIVAGGDRETARARSVQPQSLRGDPGTVFRQYLSEQDVEGEALAELFDELLHDELTCDGDGNATAAP